MKKKISLALCAVMIFACLAACGGTGKTEPTATPEPTAAPAFAQGVVDGSVYASDYIGLRFTAPEGWTFATNEELMEMVGLSMDTLGGEITDNELALELAKQATIYDMFAKADDNTANVMVMLENLSASMSSKMTEEEYADVMKQNLEAMTSISYVVGDTYTADLAGKTFLAMPATMNEMAYQEYFFLKMDKYMLCICFTNVESPASTGLVECFSAA